MGVYKYRVDGEWQRRNGKYGYKLSWVDERGKRRRKTFWGTKNQAEAKLRKIKEQVAIWKDGVSEQYLLKQGQRPISEIFEEHKEHLRERDAAEATIATYRLALQTFIEYIDDIPLSDIRRQTLLEFQKKRAQDVKSGTVSNNLRGIRTIINFARKKGYILRSPFFDIDLSIKKSGKVGERTRWLYPDELKELFQVIKKHGDEDTYDLVMMYLYSGARAKEILIDNEFTWNNIFKRERQIKLYGSKTKKFRWIPLIDTVADILEKRRSKLPADCEYPFPFRYNNVYDKVVRSLLSNIEGFEDVSIQTLRRTTGMLLLEAGWDIFAVSEYLGHSDVRVTREWYVGLSNPRKQQMGEDLMKIVKEVS